MIKTTLVMVAPLSATKARALGVRFGATIVDDPGSSMADAINAGLSARTIEDLYVWIGDDDELVAHGVVRLARELEIRNDAVAAFGQCDYVDEQGKILARNRAGNLALWLLPWGPNLIPHPGTVIRIDALEEIGGFSPGLRYALDLDVFLRLRKLGKIVPMPVVSACFRWHSESATVRDRRASSKEAIQVKNSHLPISLRRFSPLWNYPVAWLSATVASRLNQRMG